MSGATDYLSERRVKDAEAERDAARASEREAVELLREWVAETDEYPDDATFADGDSAVAALERSVAIYDNTRSFLSSRQEH